MAGTLEGSESFGAPAAANTSQTTGPFGIQGINHLALVCSDMAATVAFYEGLLGMPLVKTVDLGGGVGQHLMDLELHPALRCRPTGLTVAASTPRTAP